jgi:hypothetical protein
VIRASKRAAARSAVDCHHELRGVIITTGGRERPEPRIATIVTDRRRNVSAFCDFSGGCSAYGTGEHGLTASLDTWIAGAP